MIKTPLEKDPPQNNKNLTQPFEMQPKVPIYLSFFANNNGQKILRKVQPKHMSNLSESFPL